MDSDLLRLLLALAFVVFGLLGTRKKRPTPTARRPAPPHPPRPRPAPAPPQQTTARRADILRELERLLGGGAPTPRPEPKPAPRPPAPAPRSLEVTVDEAQETTRWEAGLDREAASLESLEGIGEAEHARFHEQYVDRPAAKPVEIHHANLRQAVIWAEILGAPVSERMGG